MKRLLALFLSCLLVAQPAFAIETLAKQAFLVDTTTGAVLINKNGDEQMHPSSMSKLMLIYIVFGMLKDGSLKPSDTFPVSEKAWRTQGSKTFVHVGDQVAVEDLLHGVITQSGNDACIVLAEGLRGSEESFAKEMNAVAGNLGLKSSNFTNATGWPDDNHLMSARDLAKLSERIIEDFPEYYPFFSMKEFTYNKITQPNRNRLLGVNGVDGLKTGHTDAGGYGITLSAKQGDRRLILVINGLDSDDARVKEGASLLGYGFREFKNQTIIKKGDQIGEAEVWFGTKRTVPLIAAEDVVLTLPTSATAQDIKMRLTYNGPLQAPVEKGQNSASIIVEVPGQEDLSVPLVNGEDVPKISGFGRMMAVLKYYLHLQQ